MKKAWERLQQRCRASLEQIGPQTRSLESVDYFGTSEYFSGEKKKNLNEQTFDRLVRTNASDVVNFHCIQMSLVMSTSFILAVIEVTRHVHHLFAL